MATSNAPVSIGRVALTVNRMERMAVFYEHILGLNRIWQNGESLLLGQADRPLIELREDKAAIRRPFEAGLFHTAFLLPNRAALAHWLAHARGQGVEIDGFADHLVSEALYLHDPEGNGIEVYCDRPREEWPRTGKHIRLKNVPLNLSDLMRSAIGYWHGAPDDTVIGHVHLQVGDIRAADEFMTNRLGLEKTSEMPSASFYGSGGYHHHLAGNVWHSQGAQVRSANTTGLAEIELLVDPDVLQAGPIADPWGTQFNVTATLCPTRNADIPIAS